jgi:hypothetical protein
MMIPSHTVEAWSLPPAARQVFLPLNTPDITLKKD